MEKWSREEIEDVDGLTFSKQDIHEHLKYLDIREDDYSHGVSAEIIRHLLQQLDEAEKRVADYEEVIADHKRLVRELDFIWNGKEGAAEQASLCDLVAQIEKDVIAMMLFSMARHRRVRG